MFLSEKWITPATQGCAQPLNEAEAPCFAPRPFVALGVAERDRWATCRFEFASLPFLAIITVMFYLTPNTILVCTAARGPIEDFPCRIAPRCR